MQAGDGTDRLSEEDKNELNFHGNIVATATAHSILRGYSAIFRLGYAIHYGGINFLISPTWEIIFSNHDPEVMTEKVHEIIEIVNHRREKKLELGKIEEITEFIESFSDNDGGGCPSPPTSSSKINKLQIIIPIFTGLVIAAVAVIALLLPK